MPIGFTVSKLLVGAIIDEDQISLPILDGFIEDMLEEDVQAVDRIYFNYL